MVTSILAVVLNSSRVQFLNKVQKLSLCSFYYI